MKITHRTPPQSLRSATLDPAYESEVIAATQRSEAAYARAIKRAILATESAARKVAKQTRQTSTATDRATLRLAQELYAERMRELEVLQALAQSHGAPARNRGTKSFRPVPAPKTL